MITRRDFVRFAVAGIALGTVRSSFAGLSESAGKRIFISDVHLSLLTGSRYEWFSRYDAENLTAFLESIRKDKHVTQVIILGDLMDTWVYPVDVKPPTYKEIVNATPEIFGAFSDIKSAGKEIIYVPGNHDMGVKEDDLEGTGIVLQEKPFEADGIHAEHGHRGDVFNKRDKKYELPLGYYLSRFSATCVDSGSAQYADGKGAKKMAQDVLFGNIGELIKKKELKDAIEDIATREKIKNVVLPGGDKISIEEIARRYNYLCEEQTNKCISDGIIDTTLVLDASRTVKKEEACKIVILGHSHNAICKEFPWRDANALPVNTGTSPASEIPGVQAPPCAVYVNTGSWCEWREGRPYTYVETKIKNGAHHVKQMMWDPRKKKRKPMSAPTVFG